MKKFAFVLTLCLLLSGCGGQSKGDVKPEVEDVPHEHEVEVMPEELDVDGALIGSASLE